MNLLTDLIAYDGQSDARSDCCWDADVRAALSNHDGVYEDLVSRQILERRSSVQTERYSSKTGPLFELLSRNRAGMRTPRCRHAHAALPPL